jgi:LysM repeat protein
MPFADKHMRLTELVPVACSNILFGFYYCVSVPGAKTTAAPTKTKSPNGITTPTPIQTGMTKTCNKFHLVKSGDGCDTIATANKVPVAAIERWNPAVGSTCTHLIVGYYVCVDVIGYVAPSKTTNRIATPTPFEPGMVKNCKKFYRVKSGDQCDTIATKQKVTVADIEKWNPHVGSGCRTLLLGDYICVGLV